MYCFDIGYELSAYIAQWLLDEKENDSVAIEDFLEGFSILNAGKQAQTCPGREPLQAIILTPIFLFTMVCG